MYFTLERQAVGIFGFSPEDPIGKYGFPPVQAAPSFPSSFPHLFGSNDQLRCLIPCAIDQVRTYPLYDDLDGTTRHWLHIYLLSCL
jgi:hypothetical protein